MFYLHDSSVTQTKGSLPIQQHQNVVNPIEATQNWIGEVFGVLGSQMRK